NAQQSSSCHGEYQAAFSSSVLLSRLGRRATLATSPYLSHAASPKGHGELLVAAALNPSTPAMFGQSLSPHKQRAKRRQQNIPQQGFLFSSN
ncbi:MAG TPA: hypothetical protein VKY85_08315, partial [Candidatus Angelobacter sp.]|nr:hypothetical protein [Candidatus Angelobacter sp.]